MSESGPEEIPVEATEEELTYPHEQVELRIRGPRIGIWTLINGLNWGSRALVKAPAPALEILGPTKILCQDVVEQYHAIDDVDEARDRVGRGIKVFASEDLEGRLDVELLENLEAVDD